MSIGKIISTKHPLLAFVFLLYSNAILAQDTIYFNETWDKVSVKDSAIYFRPKPVLLDDGRYLIKDYYSMTNTLQNEAVYNDSEGNVQNGYSIWYYENGNKSGESTFLNGFEEGRHTDYYKSGNKYSECNYIKGIANGLWAEYWDEKNKILRKGNYLDGLYDGELIGYFKNGSVERREEYKKGELLSGKCYRKTGEDTVYFGYIDHRIPHFPGGDDKYDRYVCQHRNYPKYCRRHKIEGKVYVWAYFDESGKIYKTVIDRKVHPLLDEEALRIINEMPNWQPAISEDGKAIRSERKLDILFE